MQISEDTRNVMDYLEKYSGNTLRSADELSIILDILAGKGSFDLMNEMIFIGKSVSNLYNTLSTNRSDKSSLMYLETEYQKSKGWLIEAIRKVLHDMPECSEKEKLERTSMPEGSELLLDLAHDLSILKELQAHLKTDRK